MSTDRAEEAPPLTPCFDGYFERMDPDGYLDVADDWTPPPNLVPNLSDQLLSCRSHFPRARTRIANAGTS
jgi:hypothetical protein